MSRTWKAESMKQRRLAWEGRSRRQPKSKAGNASRAVWFRYDYDEYETSASKVEVVLQVALANGVLVEGTVRKGTCNFGGPAGPGLRKLHAHVRSLLVGARHWNNEDYQHAYDPDFTTSTEGPHASRRSASRRRGSRRSRTNAGGGRRTWLRI